MTCDHATNLISARIDGEILPAEQADLDAHLSACPGCRTTADVLGAQDTTLARAFTPHRNRVEPLISATMSRVRQDARPRPSAFRMQWLNTVLSAAAGFAIALLILQPWKERPTLPIATNGNVATQDPILTTNPATRALAHLALATGRIDVLPPDETEWQPMSTGAAVLPGSRIRTPDGVRCEFAMSDGSEIRLNENSEVLLAAPRTFDVAKGRMWSTVAADEVPFNVALNNGATVAALGTQFDVQLEEQKATVIVVEGATEVKGKGRNTIVYPGERVEIIDGTPGQAQRTYNVLVATAWVHEILAMKGKNNVELQHRLNELFAELGQTKVKVLLETEIRSLGNHAIIPLTRYLQSDRSRAENEGERRDMAARILEDIAEPWAIPDLINLLAHEDGNVRLHAARALNRLTGEDHGYALPDWRTGRINVPEAVAKWRTWFDQNRDKFPTTGPLKDMQDKDAATPVLKKANAN
jgi:hypothetical protein